MIRISKSYPLHNITIKTGRRIASPSIKSDEARRSRVVKRYGVVDIDGRSFLGRTGWANGTYMSNSSQRYNAAGRLVYDSSRHLCTVNYNTLGLPTLMSPATTSISSSPRKERVYDAHGNKIRQTDIEVTGPAGPKVIADRRYIGSFILNCDTLERVNFGGGYLDSKGKPHFLFTDWQGNVTMTTDSRGHIEQHVGY